MKLDFCLADGGIYEKNYEDFSKVMKCLHFFLSDIFDCAGFIVKILTDEVVISC